MSKKKETLDLIRKARVGHKRWMSYAKAIIMGLPLDKKAVPLIETDCSFGKWYYGEGQIFSSLETFEAIEDPHTLLHGLYMKLYKLQKEPPKGGFIFTPKRLNEKKRKKEMEKITLQMEATSNLLLEALKDLENEIKNMSDLEIQNLE